MQSEHHTLFAALAQVVQAKRILEIGTYNGKCAAILALLFPKAEIDTIDLPDDHPLFISSYNRQDEESRLTHIRKRNALLGQYRNIKFDQVSSLVLSIGAREKYDLIWIDGDHGYPTVAIDIANAIRLIGPNGWILCDDVRTAAMRQYATTSIYGSTGAHDTLASFKDAGILDFRLVSKRLDAKSNAHPRWRKYVAVCRRLGDDELRST
jgi:predicted O-methyltransferase YrrM